MLVCDLCLLNLVILVVRGLSGVPGTLGQILLSYLVHMHSRLRSLRQGQVHVGPITWEVLPQYTGSKLVNTLICFVIKSPKPSLRVDCTYTFHTRTNQKKSTHRVTHIRSRV
jgi:hypothetical protein